MKGPTKIVMIPTANTVVRHPYWLMPQTNTGTNNPPTLTPPSTIEMPNPRRRFIHAFVAVSEGVNPPELKPTDSNKNAA